MDPQALRKKLRGTEGLLVAGLLSGTSADGIDVGLARFRLDDPKGQAGSPELLAFETVPFEQGDLAYHHRHTEPPDPRSRVDSIPPALSQLILRMLAKSPDDRPAGPADVGRELQVILDACTAAAGK